MFLVNHVSLFDRTRWKYGVKMPPNEKEKKKGLSTLQASNQWLQYKYNTAKGKDEYNIMV